MSESHSSAPSDIPEIALANHRLYARLKREFFADRNEEDLDIFYPGCGTDEGISSAFRQSRCTYLDLDASCTEALERRLQRKRPNHRATVRVGSALEEQDLPKTDVDLLVLMHPGFPVKHLLDLVKSGGYAVTGGNEREEVFDVLRDHPDFSLVGTIREKVIPQRVEHGIRKILRTFRCRYHKRFSTGSTIVDRDPALLAECARPAATEAELRKTLPLFYGDAHLADLWYNNPAEYLRMVREGGNAISPKANEIDGLGLYVFQRQ